MKTKKYIISTLIVLSSLLILSLSFGATRSHRREERRDRREERNEERSERREERSERREERQEERSESRQGRRDSRHNNIPDYVKGEIIVQFTEEVYEDFKSRIEINSPQIELIEALRDTYGEIFDICNNIEQIEQVFSQASEDTDEYIDEDIEDPFGLKRTYKFKVPRRTNIIEACIELSSRSEIVYAEPNSIMTAFIDNTSSEDRRERREDRLQNRQWGLGTIKAHEAWEYSKNYSRIHSLGKGVTVAVVDTGVDLNHRDLRRNIRRRRGNGRNFAFGTIFSDDNPTSGPGDGKYAIGFGSPNDRNGHGTHCSGIIGARKNGRGIVGVAPKSKIMPVKVLNVLGWGTSDNCAKGIWYAARKRAKVISCSFGGYVGAHREYESRTVKNAVNDALGKGCVVVAAAGNDIYDRDGKLVTEDATKISPANIPGVLTVASINSNERVANSSCYGRVVDVAAPGVSILSTLPDVSEIALQVAINAPNLKVAPGYYLLSGTSMACPHVAGLAALIFSVNPDLSNYEVIEIIKRTAKDINADGKDDYTGYGLIDAERAVREAIRRAVTQ